MVANADPKQVESTVEKIKEVERELVKVEQNPEIRDHCQCLEIGQCPEEKIGKRNF